MLRLECTDLEEAVTERITCLPMKRGFVHLAVVLDWAVMPGHMAVACSHGRRSAHIVRRDDWSCTEELCRMDQFRGGMHPLPAGDGPPEFTKPSCLGCALSIFLQLERLRRHYELSVRTYDHVSLLDLSHTLRVWADLKQKLPGLHPLVASSIAFKSAIPAKKATRAARGHAFVFAYMPGGVRTYASKGQLAGAPGNEPKASFTLAAATKLNSDGSIDLKNYAYVSTSFAQPLVKALSAEDVSRGNFVQWLGAEAVRLAYPAEGGKLVTETITREVLIRRVANTLDASHPAAPSGGKGSANRYDPAIKHLLQYTMGGLPLPYFVLLKAAQDILQYMPPLLRR